MSKWRPGLTGLSGTSNQTFISEGSHLMISDTLGSSKLNQEIQNSILRSLYSCYPDYSTDIIRKQHEEQDLANLNYLKELGLVNAALERTLSGAFVFEGAAITAKGIEHLKRLSLKVDGAVEMKRKVQENYAFVAMSIDPANAELEDILEAIKEGALRCGVHAERVDEYQSNERITDRILESIDKAEYIIVDLTNSRPNVFYEAGYAQGIGKTPVYIAKYGTKLEFDLKDYPVIFFKNMKQLKDSLESRIRALAKYAEKPVGSA